MRIVSMLSVLGLVMSATLSFAEEERYVFSKADVSYAVALYNVPEALKELDQPRTTISAAWSSAETEGTHYHFLINRCGHVGCLPWKTLTVVEDRRREIADAPPEYTAALGEVVTPPFVPKHPLMLNALTAVVRNSGTVAQAREIGGTVFEAIAESDTIGSAEYTFVLGQKRGAWTPKKVTGVVYITEQIGGTANNPVWRAALIGVKN